MKTNRGDWHRRDQRGGAPPPVAGAGQHWPCSFCDKTFRTEQAVTQHERDYHAKRIRKLLAEGTDG